LGWNPSIDLGLMALQQRDLPAAERYGTSVLQLAERTANSILYVQSKTLLGAVALQRGKLEDADRQLHKALEKARAHRLLGEEASILLELGRLHQLRGDSNTARQVLRDLNDLTELGSFRLP
jgi:Flp pilus assembly protein TadD